MQAQATTAKYISANIPLAKAASYDCVCTVNFVRDFDVESHFHAVRSDYRYETVPLLDSLAPEGAVNGLIIGSSLSILLEAERMRQLAGGQRFFNFGLGWARAKGFFATLRFARSRGQRPMRVIIRHPTHSLRELPVGKPDALSKARVFAGSLPYRWKKGQSVHRLRWKPALRFLADGPLRCRDHEEQLYPCASEHLVAKISGLIQQDNIDPFNLHDPVACGEPSNERIWIGGQNTHRSDDNPAWSGPGDGLDRRSLHEIAGGCHQ